MQYAHCINVKAIGTLCYVYMYLLLYFILWTDIERSKRKRREGQTGNNRERAKSKERARMGNNSTHHTNIHAHNIHTCIYVHTHKSTIMYYNVTCITIYAHSQSERLAQVQKEEQEMLETHSIPLRNYLMRHVMPTLTEGLIEVCKVRPDDPVDYLVSTSPLYLYVYLNLLYSLNICSRVILRLTDTGALNETPCTHYKTWKKYVYIVIVIIKSNKIYNIYNKLCIVIAHAWQTDVYTYTYTHTSQLM